MNIIWILAAIVIVIGIFKKLMKLLGLGILIAVAALVCSYLGILTISF